MPRRRRRTGVTPPSWPSVATHAWLALLPVAIVAQVWSVRERLLLSAGFIRPVEPIASLQLQPGFSWVMAAAYLAVYAWLIGTYLIAAANSRRIVPPIAAFTDVLGSASIRAALLALVVALDYVPLPVWRRLLSIAD
jgi:hypothetical protein